MSKKKIKASELTDGDCRFISLVGKGANRIPIRVMKSKEGTTMQGFEGLFKKEVSKAYVASFVVNKDADMDIAKAKIQKAGFKISDVEEKDGMTIFHQKTAPKDLEHQYIVKTSDDIGVHVVCTKAFTSYDYETKSFKELFAKAGVIPNIFVAHDVLKEVIMNSLYASDTTDSAVAAKTIKKALNEFSAMVIDMVEQIPVSAFKIEDPTLIAEVKKEMGQIEGNKDESSNEEAESLKKDEDGEVEDSTEEDATGEEAEDAEDEGTGKESEEEGDASEEEEETTEKSEEKSEDSKSESKDKDSLSEIAKSIAVLSEGVNDLKESVAVIDEIKDNLVKLEGKVEEVSKVAKSADEALSGIANTDAEDDRSSVVIKSEGKQESTLRDTAYLRVSK